MKSGIFWVANKAGRPSATIRQTRGGSTGVRCSRRSFCGTGTRLIQETFRLTRHQRYAAYSIGVPENPQNVATNSEQIPKPFARETPAPFPGAEAKNAVDRQVFDEWTTRFAVNGPLFRGLSFQQSTAVSENRIQPKSLGSAAKLARFFFP